MHEDLIKRLRELQAITEHCNEQSCGECENRELCDKHDNKTLSGTYKEAADAIEHMQKTILRLENELGVYDDLPMVDQSMVLSKKEKTTEPPKDELANNSPKVGREFGEWIPVTKWLPECDLGAEVGNIEWISCGMVHAGCFGRGGKYRDAYFRTWTDAGEGIDAKDADYWRAVTLQKPPKEETS